MRPGRLQPGALCVTRYGYVVLLSAQGRSWQRYKVLALSYLLALCAAAIQACQMSAAFDAAVAVGAITLFFGLFCAITSRRRQFSFSHLLP